eukprot:scaffold103823_cov19-Tisochrysis_lutea.AAC.1
MTQSKDKDDLLRQLGIVDDDVPDDDCNLPAAVIADFKEVRSNYWQKQLSLVSLASYYLHVCKRKDISPA